jgi:hypothetical protein
MLLVREVKGPSNVKIGEHVTYKVTKFNQDSPSENQAGKVSWLVKTISGECLTNVHHQGPILKVTIPTSWAGQAICVMPYMNSATFSVSVKTMVESRETTTILPDHVKVELFKEDSRNYASINEEPRFYVGTDVRYGSRRGLMNSGNPYGSRYFPSKYEQDHDFWAHYLYPTITCESRGAFNCINTYDRARFTFGHMQFAAHTPDANFILLFRELLGLPESTAYFPDLIIHNDRIHQILNDTLVPLESNSSTEKLQTYLNPEIHEVGQKEVEIAARFMDWCARGPKFVETLVAFAFFDQKKKLRLHAKKLPLNGLSDKLCLVVLDILHQGRGKYLTIKTALNKDDPFDALLAIGGVNYRERVATLRNSILELERKGVIGHRVYDTETGDFVEATEA